MSTLNQTFQIDQNAVGSLLWSIIEDSEECLSMEQA